MKKYLFFVFVIFLLILPGFIYSQEGRYYKTYKIINNRIVPENEIQKSNISGLKEYYEFILRNDLVVQMAYYYEKSVIFKITLEDTKSNLEESVEKSDSNDFNKVFHFRNFIYRIENYKNNLISSKIFYDDNGSKTRFESYKSQKIVNINYYDKERVAKIDYFSKNGNIILTKIFNYDSKNLTKMISKKKDKIEFINFYDKGQISKTEYYDKDEKIAVTIEYSANGEMKAKRVARSSINQDSTNSNKDKNIKDSTEGQTKSNEKSTNTKDSTDSNIDKKIKDSTEGQTKSDENSTNTKDSTDSNIDNETE